MKYVYTITLRIHELDLESCDDLGVIKDAIEAVKRIHLGDVDVTFTEDKDCDEEGPNG